MGESEVSASSFDSGLLQTRVTRGPRTESVHHAAAVLVSPDGAVTRFGPDPGSFWRSVAKPFQTLALFRAGVIDRFQLRDEEIAVVTASHAGELYHHEVVQRLLTERGLAPEALQCGTHAPFSGTERRRRLREGEPLSVLGNNCSGKHSGMLLHALALGVGAEDYLEPSHPVQVAVAEVLRLFSDDRLEEHLCGVDGCGVPTYFTPLESMARAFARLSQPEFVAEHGFTDAVDRLHRAIRAEPRAFSGEGRIPFLVSGLVGDRLFSKEGAEGVFAVWGPAGGLVIKSLDGSERGYRTLLPDLLAHVGWIDTSEVEKWRESDPPIVRNVARRPVGELRSVLP